MSKKFLAAVLILGVLFAIANESYACYEPPPPPPPPECTECKPKECCADSYPGLATSCYFTEEDCLDAEAIAFCLPWTCAIGGCSGPDDGCKYKVTNYHCDGGGNWWCEDWDCVLDKWDDCDCGVEDCGPPCDNPCECASTGDPVLMRNGEYRLSVTDVYIRGRVLPVEIKRAYGSQRDHNSRFGYNWDMNYNLRVIRLDDPNTIALLNEGSKYEYTRDTNDPNIYTRSTDPGNYFYYDDVNDTFTLAKTNDLKYDFDISDNLSSITDENGNSITFEYDPNDNALLIITDDLGRKINLSYNNDGLLDTITDFAGRTWEYWYDPCDPCSNDLWGVTGPNTPDYPDLSTTYLYDSNHNLTYIYDANDREVLRNYYDYDNEDKVEKQDIGDGYYLFAYDPNNQLTTITDREGFETRMVYGDSGQLVSRTVYTADANDDPNFFTTTYTYNSNLQEIRETFPAGNCVDYTYNANGSVTGIYKKIGPDEPNDANDPNVIATLYTYDPNFVYKVKTERDPEDNITTYDYNDLTGNLEKITYPEVNTPAGPNQPVVNLTYNAYGQVKTVTAADGIVTKYQYYDTNDVNDPNCGQLWKVIVDANETDGLKITTEYKYDILGDVIEVNDPNGNITKFAYNALEQLTQTTAPSPFGYVTGFSYDENGNQSGIEREIAGPNQVTSFIYNVLNNLVTVTDPCGYVTTFGYDKNENQTLITDAEDHNTVSVYNERNLLAKVTDANGSVTEYTYNDNGNLKEIKDANGNITTYSYDGFDRLIKITYPDDSNEVFSYDKNSNVTSKKNRKDETIYYEYDALNRLIVKNRPDDPNIYFSYDIAGRLVEVNDGRAVSEGGGITTYTYDRIGRVNDVNDILGKVVSYQYDERGLRTKLDHPGPPWITYKYDELGRLTQIKHRNASFGNNGVLAEYQYDELSRRKLLTLGNDANAAYSYDLANRLTNLTNKFNGSGTGTFDYTHDDVGNRLTMTVDGTDEDRYTYDSLYQLTDVNYAGNGIVTYSYDTLGNRTSVVNGGTANYILNDKGLNQYGSVADANYSYDKNGNLTDDGTYKYYYDCENRLTDVNNQSDQPIASYKYDYQGRRVKKIVYGSPNVTTKYCYDGDQVIVEYDGDGYPLRRFYYGPGIDEPICMWKIAAGGAMFYYHFDGLGSVVALSDVNGVKAEYYEYDVYGNTTIRDPNGVILDTSNVGNPYMFTGRRFDSETGLYYYRARYYSPYIGRFPQTDPIGYRAGLNLYTYVGNNPTNRTDPLGLKCKWRAAGSPRWELQSEWAEELLYLPYFEIEVPYYTHQLFPNPNPNTRHLFPGGNCKCIWASVQLCQKRCCTPDIGWHNVGAPIEKKCGHHITTYGKLKGSPRVLPPHGIITRPGGYSCECPRPLEPPKKCCD